MDDYLDQTVSDQVFITEFSLHSIGLMLVRRGRPDTQFAFVQDTIIDRDVHVVSLPLDPFLRLGEIMRDLRLDYDDAYQYAVAEHFNLRLVSFDADFDGTPLGRSTPAQVLAARP